MHRCTTDAVAAAVADAHRREWGFVLAATVRVTRDLDLAEECVQDAYARALRVWEQRGIPARPAAWLTTAARNRALDVLRREATLHPAAAVAGHGRARAGAPTDPDDIPDDRLRLSSRAATRRWRPRPGSR